MHFLPQFSVAAAFCAVAILPAPLRAQVAFQVDPTQSQVRLSGNIVAFDGELSAPMSAQTAGSLMAVYNGSVNVALSNTTIQFTGSSFVAAETNATPQQPEPGGFPGSATADYGATAETYFFGPVVVYAALRNLALDLNSSAETTTGGNFDASSLQFSFSTNANGAIDYEADAFGESGSSPLTGNATESPETTGSLVTTGSVQILSIPVNVTFTQGSGVLQGTTLHMSGQIVAIRSVAGPVIDSITVTNGTVLLTVQNATLQSQALVSTDLKSWSPPASTSVTNESDLILFRLPAAGGREFFRIEQ